MCDQDFSSTVGNKCVVRNKCMVWTFSSAVGNKCVVSTLVTAGNKCANDT